MKTTSLAMKLFVLNVVLMAAAVGWPPPGATGRAAGARGDNPSARGDKNRTEAEEDTKLFKQSYALIVGASDYQSWERLSGAQVDVREVAALLEKHGFKVTVALNPTRAQLDKHLGEFKAKNDQGGPSRFLFYFAGHGYTRKLGTKVDVGYIVPSDAPLPAKDLEGFAKAAISMDEMEAFARNISPSHALFVFDSCFSGSLFSTMRGVPPAIDDRTKQPVRLFITAGTAEQRVPDVSIFRAQFVKALTLGAGDDKYGSADRNNDGYVTGSELGEFLYDTVARLTNGKQTPRYDKINVFELNQGDFVFEVGKRPITFRPFPLGAKFYPSGWMGDGEVAGNLSLKPEAATIEGRKVAAIRIEYRKGQKGWAGIYWQHPDKNWGDKIGVNLVGAKKISFYAKGEQGGEIVEFISGGIDSDGKPYKDSYKKTFGPIPLTNTWAKYDIDLSELSDQDLSSVIGGFAWVASGGFDKSDRLVTYLAEMKVE